MNGLLSRLAEQALGRASPVRSVMRLPFAAAPVLQAPPGPLPMAEELVAQQSLRSGPRLDKFGSDQSSLLSDGPLQREGSVGATLAELPAPLLEPSFRYNDARLDAPQFGSGSSTTGDPRRGSVVDPPGVEDTDQRGWEPIAADATPPLAPHPLASQGLTKLVRFAEPLLPLQPNGYAHGQYERTTLPAAYGGLESSGATEDIIEVHVSIGRIEVTAVHESSKAKKEPVSADQPMSLNEYLAKRGGGGS